MAWDTWKEGTFAELETDEMGMQAQSMLKKVAKLAREVKVCTFIYILPSPPHCLSHPSPTLLSRFLHAHPFTLLSPSPSPCPLPQDKTNWTITGSLRGRIETFKKTMPLIQDLKNPAMRLRHWTQLQEEIQKPFDHTSTCKARHAVYSTCTTQHAVDMLYTVHVQRNML